MDNSDVQAFVQLEQQVLTIAKDAAAVQAQNQQLKPKQEQASQAEQQLLKTIDAARDSDAVAALAPLIGTGLDDASLATLNQFILQLNAAINAPAAAPPATKPARSVAAAKPEDVAKLKTALQATQTSNDVVTKVANSIVVGGESAFSASATLNRFLAAQNTTANSSWQTKLDDLRRRIAVAAATIQMAAQPGDAAAQSKNVSDALRLAFRCNVVLEPSASNASPQDLAGMTRDLEARMSLLDNPKLDEKQPDKSKSLEDANLKTVRQMVVLHVVTGLHITRQKLAEAAKQSSKRRRSLGDLKLKLENFQAHNRRSVRVKDLNFAGGQTNSQQLRAVTSQAEPSKVGLGVQVSVRKTIAQLINSHQIDLTRSSLPTEKQNSATSLAMDLEAASAATAPLQALIDKLTSAQGNATVNSPVTAALQSDSSSSTPAPSADIQDLTNLLDQLSATLKLFPTSTVSDATSPVHEISDLINSLQQATKSNTPLVTYVQILATNSGAASKALSALQKFASDKDKSFTDLIQEPAFSDFLNSTALSQTWLTNFVMGIDPKAAAKLNSSSQLGSLTTAELKGPLGDLSASLLKIAQSDAKARIDLVQNYLNQIYQSEIDLYQEQERHYKALDQIAQLETQRWTILQQINQNVSVTFASLGEGNLLDEAGDRKPRYFPYEGVKQEDYDEASKATATTPPSAIALRDAQKKRLTDAVNQGRAVYADPDLKFPETNPTAQSTAPLTTTQPTTTEPATEPAEVPKNMADKSSQIFASLRSLALAARRGFLSTDAKAIGQDYQSSALAASQRLKDLIKLLNNSLLMESVNLRFSLDDARWMNKELLWHELQLDQLQSSVQEANIQYRLDDLKIYHSGGITKDDIKQVSQDIAQAIELGIIAGKVK